MNNFPISVSAYGPGEVIFKRVYSTEMIESLEIYLALAFRSKARLLNEKWGHLSYDQKNALYGVFTFFVPSSSDGYGFKIYHNKHRNKNTIIKVVGSIENGRLCNNRFFIFN